MNLTKEEIAAVVDRYHNDHDLKLAGVQVPFVVFDNRDGRILSTGTSQVSTLWAQEDSNHWNEDAPHRVVAPLNAVYGPADLYVDGGFVVRRKADDRRADLVDELALPAVIKPFDPTT